MAQTDVLFVLNLVAFSGIALLTCWSIFATIWTKKRGNQTLHPHKYYEDEDGEATEESLVKSRDLIPKLCTNFFAIVGLGVAIGYAAKVILEDHWGAPLAVWFRLGAWALIFGQSLLLFLEPLSTRRYALGILISASAVFLLIDVGSESYAILARRPYHDEKSLELVNNASIASQIICAVLLWFSALSIPRRPDVYRDGHLVDAQYTVSVAKLFQLAWADPFFKAVSSEKQVSFQDIPTVDNRRNARTLLDEILSFLSGKKTPLWRAIFRSHQSGFLLISSMSIVQTVVRYLPQLCLFKTLQLLEQQQSGGRHSREIWFWTAGIGVSRIIHNALEVRQQLLASVMLQVPVRVQISSLVFEKAMRVKDIKGVDETKGESEKSEATESNVAATENAKTPDITVDETLIEAETEAVTEAAETDPLLGEENGNVDAKKPSSKSNDVDRGGLFSRFWRILSLGWLTQRKNKRKDEKNEEAPTRTQRSTLNLMSTDAQRVSDFSGFMQFYVTVIVSITIATYGLVKLIGWASLGAGLLGLLVVAPMNVFVTKGYAKCTAQLMKQRDEKVTTVTEALQGVRQIKFSAAESSWQEKILGVRDKELKQLRKLFYYTIALRFFFVLSPIMLSMCALCSYALIYGTLPASIAFTALSVFENVEWCFSVLPLVVTMGLEASNSLGRIAKFLDEEDKPENTVPGEDIEFVDAAVAWPAKQKANEDGKRFTLQNVNLQFPKGKLSVITGKSGSGKSLLLSSIIGEADVICGKVVVPRAPSTLERYDSQATVANWIIPSSVAFVAQIPWIEHATIKDNVLFGLPYDEIRYQETIEASALRKDLDMLEDGELTEIGAKGINLSGGQRWRVTFARALYSRAGILVLDDIFSAVDSHVGRHLFTRALTGKLGEGRTRILATHHASLVLSKTAYAIKICDNGEVQASNQPDNLIEDDEQSEATSSSTPVEEVDTKKEPTTKKPKKFVEEEYRETGAIKWKHFKTYLQKSGGLVFWGFVSVIIIISQAAMFGRTWWVKIWTSSNEETESQPAYFATEQQDTFNFSDNSPKSQFFYLGIYVAISLSASLFEVCKTLAVYNACLRASRRFFVDVVTKVLRAKLRWFDTVPMGRILNRLTTDFNMMDMRLGGNAHTMISAFCGLIIILIAGFILSPLMLIPSAVLMTLTIYYAYLYIPVAREMRRLMSISGSPVFDLFGTTLAGIGTVRAFDKRDEYTSQMIKRLNEVSQSNYAFWFITYWMAYRMGLLGAFFGLLVAIGVAYEDVNAALAGFALIFALDYTSKTEDVVNRFSNLQVNFNCVERIAEYTEMETEDYSGEHVPANWPAAGSISIDKLYVGYAPDLPDVLKGLSVDISSRQRVGVIGRTGAGKSSLTLAMFRFLEARSGTIKIDDRDISKIKLDVVRSRLAIIPQDPVLFSGTIRQNLDPFNQHTDEELFGSLRRVHLVDPPIELAEMTMKADAENAHSTFNIFTSLESRISEGGLNLSQGQRQLLCLARAIISHSRVMIMDEATSSVDKLTDTLIQRSIRTEFSHSTLLVIAHRLSTVADFDRILVMDDGRAVEFGSPRELYEQKGEFWKLVAETGERGVLEDIIMGRKEGGGE